MRLAAGQAAPRHRKSLPLLTPEYLPGLSAFTRRYFQDLYRRLRLPFVMVFDNYQEVPTDSPFHEVIRDGLTQVPEGGNVIVISRSDPPATLARLRASHAMLVIDWETMRLTLEEAHGIARLRGRGGRLRNTVELLHGRTDGWAAGLILLLERARAGDPAPQPVRVRTPEAIFDYLEAEAFKKIDRKAQEFLLKTGFLSKMTAQMAEQLADLRDGERILSDLARNNYFTEVRPLPQPVYVYHPLFREFLTARAREAFSPADLALVQRRAAAILEAAGEVEDAAHLRVRRTTGTGLSV
jgi:ATP/maltotriose-dependent transcriptional regulator MalT